MTFDYPPLRDVRINMVKCVRYVPGAHLQGPFPGYAMIWAMEGTDSLEVRLDGRKLPVASGSVLLMRPGGNLLRDNRREGAQTATMGELWFSFRRLPRGWPPPASWPLLLTPPADSAFFAMFRLALTLAFVGEPERTAIGQAIVPPLLLMLLTGHHAQYRQPQASDLPEPLARVWQVVAHQTSVAPGQRPRRIAELAREAGVSAAHVMRLFHEHLGISAGEFMQSRRLEHAAFVLANSSLSIKEIARLTGFYDPAHFSRQFQGLFGCAPKTYRALPAERRPIVNVFERVKSSLPEPLHIASYAGQDLIARTGGKGASSAALLRALRHDLAANQSRFDFPAGIGRRRWHSLSLAPFVTPLQAGPGGLFGPETRHLHLPPGTLRAHGIPFVVTGECGGGQQRILLRSARLQECHLPESVELPVPGRAAGLGVLHACAWTMYRREPTQLGEYEILYADQRRVTLPVMDWKGHAPPPDVDAAGPMLRDYWPDAPQIETRTSRKITVCDPEQSLTTINYLYVYWWENPRPEVPLQSLTLRGRPDSPGILAVLGVTLLAAASAPEKRSGHGLGRPEPERVGWGTWGRSRPLSAPVHISFL